MTSKTEYTNQFQFIISLCLTKIRAKVTKVLNPRSNN